MFPYIYKGYKRKEHSGKIFLCIRTYKTLKEVKLVKKVRKRKEPHVLHV
jgi:hypothetical protein